MQGWCQHHSLGTPVLDVGAVWICQREPVLSEEKDVDVMTEVWAGAKPQIRG